MANPSSPARVSDLHKGAFWIYGVTAMVMREPAAIVIRHAASAGLGDLQVCEELLRGAIVLGMMARLFLASGLYFDEVYLRPDSAARFLRRSYPIDFLAGLLHFLLAMGASTVVAGSPPAFALLVGGYYLFEPLRWAGAIALGHSSAPLLAPPARAAVASAAVWAAGFVFLPALAAYLLLLGLTGWEMVKLVRQYETPPA